MPGTSGSSTRQAAMMSEDGVIVECPAPEMLICNSGPLKCVICERSFVNPSALRFHRIKVHKLIQNEAEFAFSARRSLGKSLPVRYHCPVAMCKYHVNKQRYFLEMKNLKQHYMNSHADKKFSCSSCGLKFGQQRQAARHEKTCNLRFQCAECRAVYETRDGLRLHCKRHRHTSGFSNVHCEEQSYAKDPVKMAHIMCSTIPVTPGTTPVTLRATPVAFSTVSATLNTTTVAASGPPSTVSLTSTPIPVAASGMPVTLNPASARAIPAPVTHKDVSATLGVVPMASNTVPVSSGQVFAHPAITTAMSIVHVPASTPAATQNPAALVIQNIDGQRTSDAEIVNLENALMPSHLSNNCKQSQSPPVDRVLLCEDITVRGDQPPPVTSFMNELMPTVALQPSKSSQPLILPKPDALYILTNQNCSSTQPIIMVFNSTMRPLTRPGPIAPVRLAPRICASGLTARSVGTTTMPTRSCRLSEARGEGREIEVQTDTVQMANSYCETNNVANTCELAVQTLSPQNASDDIVQKACVMAETQTMYDLQPYDLVETQSRSSQVSPKAKLHPQELPDMLLGPTQEDFEWAKQRCRKRAEAGSQTQRCGQRSVCVGTPPKRQKKKRNAAVSCTATVKDVETQSDQAMQCSDMIQITRNKTSVCTGTSDMSFMHNSMVQLPVASSAINSTETLPSHLQSVNIEPMTSSLGLSNVDLEVLRSDATALEGIMSTTPASIEKINVCTDMLRANISVGTMPSPPLPLSDGTFGTDFPQVSMNTIGTDPLPGFSGSSQRCINFSAMFSQETQTSFWAEFQASIAENNATQTMESYIADTSINADAASLTMPIVVESSGVQTCHAHNSQTQTWPHRYTMPASQCKSVGVGTSLLGESHSTSFFEGMESEGLSRSIGIDTQLFDDLFPEVSSRSVAISTPLFDNMHSSSVSVSQQPVMENAMFQPIVQRSDSVCQLGHELTDLECLSGPNEG